MNEYENTLLEIEQELQKANMDKRQMANAQLSLFGNPDEGNLVRWQLDLKEDLDRIYHLLQGHIIKQDDKGNMVYAEPSSTNMKPFNEYGVQMIMNILSFYLVRNTLLSYYADEKIIDRKVMNFGYDFSDLIYNKYEELGMDTPDKRKLYPMIVREVKDSVHSAYLRALVGGERDSLRTARTVNQNEALGRMPNMPMVSNQQQQKKFKLLNPTTWI